MREFRLDRLLAGTMLALIVTAPGLAGAAPRVESAAPLPPSLGDRAAPARAQATAEPARNEKPDAGFVRNTLDKIFAASDTQISEKLRDIVAAKQLDKRFERANERKAVEAFYAAHNYAPLWIVDGALSPRAKAIDRTAQGRRRRRARRRRLQVPDFAAANGPEQLADADLALTEMC